jgi:hypothetical protein
MKVFDAKPSRLEAYFVKVNFIKNPFSYAKKESLSHLKPSSGATRHLLPHSGRRMNPSSHTCKGINLPSPVSGRRVGDEGGEDIYWFSFLQQRLRNCSEIKSVNARAGTSPAPYEKHYPARSGRARPLWSPFPRNREVIKSQFLSRIVRLYLISTPEISRFV